LFPPQVCSPVLLYFLLHYAYHNNTNLYLYTKIGSGVTPKASQCTGEARTTQALGAERLVIIKCHFHAYEQFFLFWFIFKACYQKCTCTLHRPI